MRVHGDAFDNAERLVEHDVRGFAAHSGKLLQLVDVARDLAAVLGHHQLRALDHVRSFRAVEPDGADDLFDVGWIGGRQVGYGGVVFPKRRRYLVDALVGGLGGQQHGDGQLERVAPVMQRAFGGGVVLVHALRDFDGALAFRFHGFAGQGILLCRMRFGCGQV